MISQFHNTGLSLVSLFFLLSTLYLNIHILNNLTASYTIFVNHVDKKKKKAVYFKENIALPGGLQYPPPLLKIQKNLPILCI